MKSLVRWSVLAYVACHNPLMEAHSYRLFVRGIEFYAYHGCSPEEQEIGHRYTMDLDLRVAGDGNHRDELEATIDYGTLAALASSVATKDKHRLMEFVAQRIADAILLSDERVRVCTVTLAKVKPPIPMIAADAGVSVTVNR